MVEVAASASMPRAKSVVLTRWSSIRAYVARCSLRLPADVGVIRSAYICRRTSMILESLLAYAHISAILLVVVFLTSKTALMRPDLLEGRTTVPQRLWQLDLWLWGSFVAVLATGFARMVWGVKGFGWYAENPLLWSKVALFGLMVLMSVPSSLALQRWRRIPPQAGAIRAQRRWLMWQAHVMVVIPLLGTLLAYGF